MGRGHGSITSTSSFVLVITAGATAIAAGGYHSMVLKEDGSVWATGDNEYGQLGDGSTTAKTSMYVATSASMQVATGGAKAVAAGNGHSLVLGKDGSVWAAGRNDYGQLGDGFMLPKSIFVRVVSTDAQFVVAGGWSSMIIKRDGSLWATGANDYGQLGDGTRVAKNTFVKVTETSGGAQYRACSEFQR